MGRRIYDDQGEFVWKYTFGRQPSNMCEYANKGIGKYEDAELNNEEECAKGVNDEDYYTWEEHSWTISVEELPKLKELYDELRNGHTLKELYEYGMRAVHEYVEEKNAHWKEAVGDLKWLETAKSHDDFAYYGSSGPDYSFEVYDIYAKGIEKHIKCSADFLFMTKAFINHINKYKKTRDNEVPITFFDEY